MSLRAAAERHENYGSISAETHKQVAEGSNESSIGDDDVSDDHNDNTLGDDTKVPGRRQIGVVSAVFIIFNRMIGTG